MTLISLQVSELVIKYDRECLTVWGNASNQVVKKCYKEVQLNKNLPSVQSCQGVCLPHKKASCWLRFLIQMLNLLYIVEKSPDLWSTD